MSDEEWDELVDSWLRQAEPFESIRSIDGAMIPLDEMTALEYLESDPLDLDYLSWAPLLNASGGRGRPAQSAHRDGCGPVRTVARRKRTVTAA